MHVVALYRPTHTPWHTLYRLKQSPPHTACFGTRRARIRLLDTGDLPAAPETEAARRAAKLDDFKRIEDKLKRAADVAKGGVKKAKGKGFGAPAQPAAEGAGASAAAPAARVDMGELLERGMWGAGTAPRAVGLRVLLPACCIAAYAATVHLLTQPDTRLCLRCAAALGEAPLSDDEMSQVVRINCWGMPRSEFAISVLRQEPSQAIVGTYALCV